MKYIIPAIPPSNNKYIGRNMAWKYRDEKNEWAWLIKAYCKSAPAEPFRYVSVKISYCFPTRGRRDPDNFSGKFILDGLVSAGILADDSFDCITLSLEAGYDRESPRTEIEIIGELI